MISDNLETQKIMINKLLEFYDYRIFSLDEFKRFKVEYSKFVSENER